MKTEKTVSIEFYLLNEDRTWDTDFISVPEELYLKYRESFNPEVLTDWVHKNTALHRNICMVGVYNDSPEES